MIIVGYTNHKRYNFMIDRLGHLISSFGFPFIHYTQEWLNRQQVGQLIDTKAKGGGYWAWKPLVILDALAEDDTVIYLDSSVVPQSKNALINFAAQTDKISAVAYGEPNGKWTSDRCFEIMGCPGEGYRSRNQVWAGVVCAKDQAMVMRWLRYCLLPECIQDGPGSYPGFREHRHDQSILTNLMLKYVQEPYVTMDFVDDVRYL